MHEVKVIMFELFVIISGAIAMLNILAIEIQGLLHRISHKSSAHCTRSSDLKYRRTPTSPARYRRPRRSSPD